LLEEKHANYDLKVNRVLNHSGFSGKDFTYLFGRVELVSGFPGVLLTFLLRAKLIDE